MNVLNDLKISTKLFVLAGAMLLGAGAIGYTGLTGLRSVTESLERLYRHDTVPTGDLGRMAKDFQRVRANLAFLLIATDPADIEHDRQVIGKLTSEMDSLGHSFESTLSAGEISDVYRRYAGARAMFLPLQERITALALGGRKDEARSLMLVGDARTAAHDIESDLDAMVRLMSEAARANTEASNASAASAGFVVIAVLAAALAAGVGLSILIAGRIGRSLRSLVADAERLAGGDLTVTVVQTSRDEVGKLAAGFGAMVSSLRETIVQLVETSGAVAAASAQISASTEEMAAGSQEQSSQASEVASAVEEMSRTVAENTRLASTTAANANSGKQAAEQGGRAVEETVEGMNSIAETIKVVSSTVKDLGNSSEQIGDIVGVIDDIADQTNLLALNAAIEAARAGEQGRGFAVVADEVRKLAEKTTKATREIGGMITGVREKIEWAVAAADEGTVRAQKGIELANRAGVELQTIVSLSQQLTDMVSQIAAASEEQASASEQISKNIAAISAVSAQTGNATQQIAHAAGDLNRLTELLQERGRRFKVEEGKGGGPVADSGVASRARGAEPGTVRRFEEVGVPLA
ncbi:MAG TPA: methyl-accepting chemotaxis protein [Bacteroidota bacterium]|nr:methyl-accepting chemotaxis protein [Bacteroidota bacterium]